MRTILEINLFLQFATTWHVHRLFLYEIFNSYSSTKWVDFRPVVVGAALASSFILSNAVPIYISIYVSMYVSPQSCLTLRLLQVLTPGADASWPGVAYLKIAYGQTAGVRNYISQRIVWVLVICLPIIIYPRSEDILAKPACKVLRLFSVKWSNHSFVGNADFSHSVVILT